MSAAIRLLLIAASLLSAVALSAQREQRQPLTEAQVEQIREAGIDPDGRIKLYTKFASEKVDAIEGLAKRGHSAARAKRLDDQLQDLAALTDELGANLDQYGDRKADMRTALKSLTETTPRWQAVLHALAPERAFELSLKDAMESEKDLADQVSQLYKDQTGYFDLHKDEKGQERAEPK